MRSPLRPRRAPASNEPHLAGAAGILAALILAVFALALGDRYLLTRGTLASVVAASLVDLANSDRAADSLTPLSVSPVLTEVAQAKAEDMATKGYFAHTSPDGHDPWYWFSKEGYAYAYAGENLAVNFTDSVAVEDAWMNSPEHRANLLDPHYTQIGIATAEGTYEGQPTTFVAEEFGAPAPAPAVALAAPVASRAQPAPRRAAKLASVAHPTSTPAVEGAASTAPARILKTGTALRPAPWWALAIAAPERTLRYAYYALAAVVLALLAYATGCEFHRRHLRHVAAAGVLFGLMIVLLAAGDVVFFSAPVLAALP